MSLHTPWAVDGVGHPMVPPSIDAELKEIHPRLGLEYSPGLRCFIVKETWKADDPRREYIKRGEMAPYNDWSVLCPIPADVSLPEMRSWLSGQLRLTARTNAEVAQWIEESDKRTRKAADEAEAKRSAELIEETLMSSSKNIDVGRRRTKVLSVK